MSDPRTTNPNDAAPWGVPDPRQGAQPHPEQLGSRAHPQAPYAEPQYPAQYVGQHTAQLPVQQPAPHHSGQHTGQRTGQLRVPTDEAYPPARRRAPRARLPEPPAGLAVGAIVAACCLLFVELAGLAVLLVVGDRGEVGSAVGLGFRFDPNSDTVTALFGLAAYLATCFWLQAGRRFAVAANPAARFRHGPAWTWLGWWVPVAFLWVPYQVVRDVRRAVLPEGEHRVALGLWWPFWLLAGLRLVASSSQDVEMVVRSVAVVALTVALVHWVRIIREITRAQERIAGLG
jgi:hypothetical protein